MYENPLIYGKNSLDRIANLEVINDKVRITRIQEDGSIEIIEKPNIFWILASEKLGDSWVRLNGNLHYKWGKQFKTKQEFYRATKYFEDKDIFTIWNQAESVMVKDGFSYYKGLEPKQIPILSFDIETTGLDPKNSQVLLISNTFRNYFGQIEKKLFSYDDYPTEEAMILHWCEWVREKNPLILTGHNIISFDLDYLLKKVELPLGVNGEKIHQSKNISDFRVDGAMDLHYFKLHIVGREIIDTLFLAYRYDIASKKYTSYGLKNIIKQEGLEKENRTFYDASQIRFKYKNPEEWKKIKEYCVDDSDDSLALFDLMSPAQFYWSQIVPKSFQLVHESATGSQINSIMLRSYIQDKHSIPKATPNTSKFEGAISLGIPGAYKNCIRWDVASLYPSIILTYKIYDSEKDPNANFLKLMEILTHERLKNKKLAKETKKQYYKDLEQSQKIGINSGFGFMGASGLQFNSPVNAAKVTMHGRNILVKALKWSTSIPDDKLKELLDA